MNIDYFLSLENLMEILFQTTELDFDLDHQVSFRLIPSVCSMGTGPWEQNLEYDCIKMFCVIFRNQVFLMRLG